MEKVEASRFKSNPIKTPCVRDSCDNEKPPPLYGYCHMAASMRLHHGGVYIPGPHSTYEGGCVTVVDYVESCQFSIEGTKRLCADLGIIGVTGLYLRSTKGDLRLVVKDNDLQFNFFRLLRSESDRVLSIYVVSEVKQPVKHTEDEDIEVRCSDGELDGQATILYDSDYNMRSDTDLAIHVSVLEEGADVGGVDGQEEGLRSEEEDVGVDADSLETDESLVETTVNASTKGKEKLTGVPTKGKEKLPIRRSKDVDDNLSTMKNQEKLIIGSKRKMTNDQPIQTGTEKPHIKKMAQSNPALTVPSETHSNRSENTTTSPFIMSSPSVIQQLQHSQVSSTMNQSMGTVNIYGSKIQVKVEPSARVVKAPSKSKPV